MAVSDVRTNVEPSNRTGVVRLSARWYGLAAVDDRNLTITESFASGFSTDRPLTVPAPDGYKVTATTPLTTESTRSTATWNTGTTLNGFEFTTEETEPELGDVDSAGEPVPEFGIVAAMLAFLAATLIAKYRQLHTDLRNTTCSVSARSNRSASQ